MKKLVIIPLLIVSLLPLYNSFFVTPRLQEHILGNSTAHLGPIEKSVNVSVSIGENRYTIFGFTSPFAKVKIEGIGLADETTANADGYFEFNNRFSPIKSTEACLTAIDTDGRVSQTLCLPEFPINKKVSIGPIILPPTITTNKDIIYTHDYAYFEGKSIPNTNVSISIADDYKSREFALPKMDVYADDNGDYSTTLPTYRNSTMRGYATTSYLNSPSGKSNTLTVYILPLWRYILSMLLFVLEILQNFILPLIILLELAILAFLLLPYLVKRQHPLALRPHNEPMIYPHREIERRKEYLPTKIESD